MTDKLKVSTIKKSKAKILLWDLETSLSVLTSFSLYPNALPHTGIISDPFIMCGCYKWLGKDKVHSVRMTKKELKNRDDSRIVKLLSEIVEEADIIVAHNGDKFDTKYLKGRMLKHGMPPFKKVASVDTLKVSRKNFKLMSHRLDYIGRYLNLGNKLTTRSGLWMDVLNGDLDALKDMVEYNKVDVELLERVYLALLPWMDNHPNLNVILGSAKNCPNCGSSNVTKQGSKITKTGRKQQFKCSDCASWCSDGVTESNFKSTEVLR